MIELSKYVISHTTNIRNTVRKIDEGGIGFAVIVNDEAKVIGVVTDGDFRRAVLAGVDLNENVLLITNKEFKSLNKGYSSEVAIDYIKNKNAEYLPVLQAGKLIDIISVSDLIEKTSASNIPLQKINAQVVIMAGGKGTRMEPFTKILPKPLIPIGDRTMIEIIMDEYNKYGIEDFFVSVNHKANMIKAYFEYDLKKYHISYINEDKPLGTGGALKYLEDKLSSPFFVSNCDIIIKEDYSKIYEFHKSASFALTMVSSMQHFKIPYGVCELNGSGELIGIKEKPEFDFLVNAGMYLLNPDVLKFIPADTFFNITDLIEELIKRKMKIGVYPVSEKSYIDVGQWAEYKKAINILSI